MPDSAAFSIGSIESADEDTPVRAGGFSRNPIMNRPDPYLGQLLDQKYRLERRLGEGGMGAVYLATHLGTDRPVALKLIKPQFMNSGLVVERFKREARAAGRLRHPNIVDVTDFGFAAADGENIAYLVMEYLDGCTLGDVLAEEERLPLHWVVDILEQVSAAVEEAHKQGIVHRDLKPDNIWLEPNAQGGYRVKVLDFGIAKVRQIERSGPESDNADPSRGVPSETSKPANVLPDSEAETIVDAPSQGDEETVRPVDGSTVRIHTPHLAGGVAAVGGSIAPQALTHVGTVMGTPLFMSPEQCRGEPLDARSDIYSLGVIAYQMLAGAPPFGGPTPAVIRAHIEAQPTPLRKRVGKLPAGVSRLIMSALEKDPGARPPSAAAFANTLRARSDGLGALYRRAFALYSEHFPKIIKLSLIAHAPVIAVMVLTIGLQMFEPPGGRLAGGGVVMFVSLLQGAASFVTSSTIAGLIAIVVAQSAVAPLKQLEPAAALAILRRRWKPFLKTGVLATVRIFLGYLLLIVPGLILTMRYALWAQVALMEGLEKKAALGRSRQLASRSWRLVVAAMLFQLLVPVVVHGLVGLDTGGSDNLAGKVGSQFASLTSILLLPLVSIVPALLYLKLRQLGGETFADVMAQIEGESPRSGWEQRMRRRLSGTRRQSEPANQPDDDRKTTDQTGKDD